MTDLTRQLQLALHFHKSGKLNEAGAIYQQLLLEEPANTQLLYMMGTLFLQMRKYKEADSYLLQCLYHDSEHKEALNMLGRCYAGQKMYEEAICCYQRAIEVDPEFAEAYNNWGIALQRQDKHQKAIKRFRMAISKRAGYAEALNNLGLSLMETAQLKAALGYFKEAVQHKPTLVDAHCNLGIMHHDRQEYEKAAEAFVTVLKLDPKHAKSYVYAGNSFKALGIYEKALDCYRAALQLNPQDCNLLNSIGASFQDLDLHDDAIAFYQMALKIDPDHVDVLSSLGSALEEKAEFENAMVVFNKALQSEPDNYRVHLRKAALHYKLNQFKEFWSAYEWRLKDPAYKFINHYTQPVWDGEDIKDKTILIHAEPWISDDLFCAAMIKDVAADCKRCLVTCDPRLEAIYKLSFPEVEVIPLKKEPLEGNALLKDGSVDYRTSLASLGRFYRLEEGHFKNAGPYLKVSPERQAAWKTQLEGGTALKIGICWRSVIKPSYLDFTKRYKSSMTLDTCKDLFALEQTRFIKLQHGDVKEEVDGFIKETGAGLLSFDNMDPNTDFTALAALIQNLDLVISVNSATAYLAHALGKPVLMLVPYFFASHKPVLHDGAPWLCGVHCIRQEKPGDWAGVIKRAVSFVQGIQKSLLPCS
ncbi:MAG: tetratricopeptide repeat protein [Deltaproteobacteria bacterium]|nr:tetratricopeptide repeat protein [Deltaproteobacteria bacterium]